MLLLHMVARAEISFGMLRGWQAFMALAIARLLLSFRIWRLLLVGDGVSAWIARSGGTGYGRDWCHGG
jgi:hypothetical protein